jgi:hypothetical protein
LYGGEALDRQTATLFTIVFVINLFQFLKSLRQIQSASDWYEPEGILDALADTVGNAGKKVVGVGTQLWVHPLKASWSGLMWTLGEHLEDWWNICDVYVYFIIAFSKCCDSIRRLTFIPQTDDMDGERDAPTIDLAN